MTYRDDLDAIAARQKAATGETEHGDPSFELGSCMHIARTDLPALLRMVEKLVGHILELETELHGEPDSPMVRGKMNRTIEPRIQLLWEDAKAGR